MTTMAWNGNSFNLYIPSHSVHAPGNSTGLISDGELRIYQLCFCPNGTKQHLRILILLPSTLPRIHPGHPHPVVCKSFCQRPWIPISRSKGKAKACHRAKKNATHCSVYFHIPFHPITPDQASSSIIGTSRWCNLLVKHPLTSSTTLKTNPFAWIDFCLLQLCS
jgi:hypothetical protein